MISGSVPLPKGDRWRVQAVTARKGGTVMNVAFRGNEQAAGNFKVNAYMPRDVGTWFEDMQSRALRDGDISAFGHAVDVGDLRNKVTRGRASGPACTSASTCPSTRCRRARASRTPTATTA